MRNRQLYCVILTSTPHALHGDGGDRGAAALVVPPALQLVGLGRKGSGKTFGNLSQDVSYLHRLQSLLSHLLEVGVDEDIAATQRDTVEVGDLQDSQYSSRSRGNA